MKMISTEHKIKRLLQIGVINEEFTDNLLEYANNPDALVSYNIPEQGDDCVLLTEDWETQAIEWDCDFEDLSLCNIDEIVYRLWDNHLHGQMINTGYGRMQELTGYSVSSK